MDKMSESEIMQCRNNDRGDKIDLLEKRVTNIERLLVAFIHSDSKKSLDKKHLLLIHNLLIPFIKTSKELGSDVIPSNPDEFFIK